MTDGFTTTSLVDAAGPVAAPPFLPFARPSDEVVALADAAHLTPEGRDIFYATRPDVLGAAEFAGRCDRPSWTGPEESQAVGCYHSGADRIVIYRPDDVRLSGYTVETAAHELLHAAWERLDRGTRSALVPALEAAVATVPADDDLHVQLAGSVGDDPALRPTEMFAYVGTQVWRDGGLDPALESAYARFVEDRAALVAVHAGWVGVLETMRADVQAASQALVDAEGRTAFDRAQLDVDTASVARYRAEYAAQVAELDAMSASELRRLQLSWVWWDGTDLPMAPAETTLNQAAALLARDEAALADRSTALAAAEQAAATERARVDALVADLQTLQEQLGASRA